MNELNICPKCTGIFLMEYKFCTLHQVEYDKWLHAEYKIIKCCNGEWIEGTMEMKIPYSVAMKVYRCADCNEVITMESESGMLRIYPRENGLKDE